MATTLLFPLQKHKGLERYPDKNILSVPGKVPYPDSATFIALTVRASAALLSSLTSSPVSFVEVAICGFNTSGAKDHIPMSGIVTML